MPYVRFKTCNKYQCIFEPKYDLLQVLAFIISMICKIVGVTSTMLDSRISKGASILRIWSANCLIEISNIGFIYTLALQIHKIEAKGQRRLLNRLITWGQEVCYTSLHSEPASALSLPTVWSLWGNPGMARCREMATLPAGYIPQRKLPLASSSGSLGFIVCMQCCRMVDSVPTRHTRSLRL
jgi:hypothetical protein